jgi:hypothetical protein
MTRNLARLLTLLTLAARPSYPQQQPTEEPEPASPGFHVNALASYVQGYSLRYPSLAGNTDGRSLWYIGGGGTTDFGWLFPGRQTTGQVDYQLSYNRNQRFSTLNGFDHSVSMALHRQSSRRTSYTFRGSFESRLVSTAIFDGSSAQDLAHNAVDADELATGLINLGADSVTLSPVDLILYGARITTGSAAVGFSHAQSPRLTWTGTVAVGRVIRANSADPTIVALYPSATIGDASLTGNYSLSPRTRVAVAGSFMESRSERYRYNWERGSVDLQRMFGRRSFGHIEAGYGRVVDRGGNRQSRNAYTLATGVGTLAGYHTLLGTFRRSTADYRGVGLDTRVGVEFAWAYAPPQRAWTFSLSAAYEQLSTTGIGVDLPSASVAAYVSRVTASRRVTVHTRLVMEVAYVDTSSPAPLLLTGTGFRAAYIWTPSIERRRRLDRDEYPEDSVPH